MIAGITAISPDTAGSISGIDDAVDPDLPATANHAADAAHAPLRDFYQTLLMD